MHPPSPAAALIAPWEIDTRKLRRLGFEIGVAWRGTLSSITEVATARVLLIGNPEADAILSRCNTTRS